MLSGIYIKMYGLIEEYQNRKKIKLNDDQIKAIMNYYADNILIGKEPGKDYMKLVEEYRIKDKINPAKPLTVYDEGTREKRRHRSGIVRRAVSDFAMFEKKSLGGMDGKKDKLIPKRGYQILYHYQTWYGKKIQNDLYDEYNNNVSRLFNAANAAKYIDSLMKSGITKEKAETKIKEERGNVFIKRLGECYDTLIRADRMLDNGKLTDEQLRMNVCELLESLTLCNEVKNLIVDEDITITEKQMDFIHTTLDFFESEYGRITGKITMMGCHAYECIDINSLADLSMAFSYEHGGMSDVDSEEALDNNMAKQNKAIKKLDAKHNKTEDEKLILDFARFMKNVVKNEKGDFADECKNVLTGFSTYFNNDNSCYINGCMADREYGCNHAMYDFGFGCKTLEENGHRHVYTLDADTKRYTLTDDDNEEAFDYKVDVNNLPYANMRPVVFEKGDRVLVVSSKAGNGGKVTTYTNPEELYNYSLPYMNKKLMAELNHYDNSYIHKKGSPYNSVIDGLGRLDKLGRLGENVGDREAALEALDNLVKNCDSYIVYKRDNVKNNNTGSDREKNRIKTVEAVRRYANKKRQELSVAGKARITLATFKQKGLVNAVAVPEIVELSMNELISIDNSMDNMKKAPVKLADFKENGLRKAILNCPVIADELKGTTIDKINKFKTDEKYRKNITKQAYESIYWELAEIMKPANDKGTKENDKVKNVDIARKKTADNKIKTVQHA